MIIASIYKQFSVTTSHGVLNLQLKASTGSVSVIHGPSGIGKTTFLKILAGLIPADKGIIVVDGQCWMDTQKNINLSPQQRLTGFVFQDYALFPNMMVRRHLEYVTDDAEYIDRLLVLGKLTTLEQRKPYQLSGGQQQRLAILRAMAIKPRVLLMDEPFSALDRLSKNDLLINLKQLWAELNTTVIIVSHYPDELSEVADQQIELQGPLS